HPFLLVPAPGLRYHLGALISLNRLSGDGLAAYLPAYLPGGPNAHVFQHHATTGVRHQHTPTTSPGRRARPAEPGGAGAGDAARRWPSLSPGWCCREVLYFHPAVWWPQPPRYMGPEAGSTGGNPRALPADCHDRAWYAPQRIAPAPGPADRALLPDPVHDP